MKNVTFELTLSQKDIYFDQLKNSDSTLYNVGGMGYNNIFQQTEQRKFFWLIFQMKENRKNRLRNG